MARKKSIRILVVLLVILWILPVSTARAESATRLAIERQIYNYLTEQMGLNTAAACGVLANIEKESAFSLTALGDSGTSFGLCQWHDGRWSAMIAYCGSRGLNYRTLQGQMEYLYYELRTGYTSLYAQLKAVENSARGAYQAGYLWCVKFERPADMEQKGVTRGNLAQYKYWNRYSSLAAPDPTDVGDFTAGLIDSYEPEPTCSSGDYSTGMPATEPEQETEEPETTQTRRTLFKPYVPRHRPRQERFEDWVNGIHGGFLFVTLGDGRKRPLLCLEAPEEEKSPEPMEN